MPAFNKREKSEFKFTKKSDYKIQNQQEKNEVFFLAALNNCSVLNSVAPVIAFLEAGIIIFSNIFQNEDFMKWQRFYNILYVSLVVVSVLVYFLNRLCRNRLHSRQKDVILISHLYVAFIIFWNVIMLFVDFHTTSQLDFALYFTSCLVSVIIFNLSPLVVIPMMLAATAIIIIEILFVQKLDPEIFYKPNLYLFALLGYFCVIIRQMNLVLRAKQNIRIRESKIEAESANRAKSTFLATMSHEIRTPMNAIVGFSEIALKDKLSQQTAAYLEKINRAAHTLLAIINDILDFSKIESGKLEIIPAVYNLQTLVDDLESIVKVRISSKSVKLFVKIEENVPRWLFGDDIRIKQVLLNLAGNAAKFTEDGEIRISVKLHKNSENSAGNVKKDFIEGEKILLDFSVQDTGIGIKPEDLKKLFNSFQQVDMLHNRKKEGSGLGLAISKQLVSLMNGNFSVKSEYGKGSEFSFTIPQIVAKEKKNSIEEKIDFTAPNAKVLVVDDNEVNILVAQGFLAQYKCAVETCKNGAEAVEKAKNGNFDIIFMDHMMPVMDGEEATLLIREDEKKSGKKNCIVALTANAVDGARKKFLAAGFDDFLSKPIEEKELYRVMKTRIPREKCIFSERTENPLQENSKNKIDKKILKTFYSQIEKKSAMIMDFEQKAENSDENALNSYKIEVHALKSSAKICGFEDLSVCAAELEKAAIEKNLETIKQKTPVLLEKYSEAKNSLKNQPELFEEPKEILKNATEPEIRAIFSEIKNSAKNGDLEKAEKQFAALNKLEVPENFTPKVEELFNALEDIDFEKIIKICEEV
mgnify:FL=1